MDTLKRLLLVLAFVLAPYTVQATPSLTTSEYFTVPLHCYDSAGVTPIPPESVYVVVYDADGDSVYSATFDTANAVCKGPRAISYRNGVAFNEYTYFQTVGTLDGTTGGNGFYRVTVYIWNTTKDVSWRINDAFYEVGTSWGTTVTEVSAALDSLQNLDNWGAQQTLLQQVADTGQAVLDSLQSRLASSWIPCRPSSTRCRTTTTGWRSRAP